MKLRLIAILLSLVIALGSSCSTIGIPVSVPIDVPVRPVLAVCPSLPVIEGILIEQNGESVILLPLAEAEKLRTFVHSYMECSEINQVELEGYIEKLLNRLNAAKGE